jgi:hypothetical protein
MRYATTERVAIAWLGSLPGLDPSMVDPTLPPPDSSGNVTWAATGFITPHGAGGRADMYLPVAHPVVMIQCWAVEPSTGRPPWNAANNLAEIIRQGCLNNGNSQFLTLPNCDQNARLMSAYVVNEPRRTYGDVGDYACVTTDVQLHWTTH